MEYALTHLYLCRHSEGKQLEHLRAAETSLIHILGAEKQTRNNLIKQDTSDS